MGVRAYLDSATPSRFIGWSFNTAETNTNNFLTDNPMTLVMNSNVTLVAHFSSDPWIEIVWCRGRLADGLFRMKVHGRIQETYAIDVTAHLDPRPSCVIDPVEQICLPLSTNLPIPYPWQEVARVTNVLGAVEYEDPYLPNVPQRFYRPRTVR